MDSHVYLFEKRDLMNLLKAKKLRPDPPEKHQAALF